MRVLVKTSVLDDSPKAAINGTLYADNLTSEVYEADALKQLLSIPDLNWFVEGMKQVRRHLGRVFPEKYPSNRIQFALDRIEISNELEFVPKSWWPRKSRLARNACVFFSQGQRVLYITRSATHSIETFFEEIAHCLDVHHDLSDIPKYFPKHAEISYTELVRVNRKERLKSKTKQLGLPIRCEIDIHAARNSLFQEMRSLGKTVDSREENRSRLVIQNGEPICRERKFPSCCRCKVFKPKSK